VNNFKSLQDHLNHKIDKEELANLEATLFDKLNDMLKKMLSQFADKQDTKKRLSNLEKNVKSLIPYMIFLGQEPI